MLKHEIGYIWRQDQNYQIRHNKVPNPIFVTQVWTLIYGQVA